MLIDDIGSLHKSEAEWAFSIVHVDHIILSTTLGLSDLPTQKVPYISYHPLVVTERKEMRPWG
jgi:hypothetical protein